jgi:aminopeptidase-like protein
VTDGDRMLALTRELCAFPTGVVAPGNGPLFERLAGELPLELHRWPSGETFNGWVVPTLRQVRTGSIRHAGRVVLDAREHPLAVALHARSFTGRVTREELDRHLHSEPAVPDAFGFHWWWQYRSWDADWAFSLPHARRERLAPGDYDVELVVDEAPGELLTAVHDHPGETDAVVVLNAHTCHPHMANDDMAGVAVLVRLFQWLRGRRTRYTYRLVLGPEHFGSLFYLRDLPPDELDRLVGGAFVEMPGAPGAFELAASFEGTSDVDLAFRNAVRHADTRSRFVDFRAGVGNDEIVWEAPGWEVPFVSVSRWGDPETPFTAYHTSRDVPDLLVPEQLEGMLDVCKQAILALEHDVVATRLFDGLPCLSNPQYGLHDPPPAPALAPAWGRFLSCLPRYLDGRTSALAMAERHGLPFEPVARLVARFGDAGLATVEPHLAARRQPELV